MPRAGGPLRLTFRATTIEWRGPAPHVFAPMPAKEAEAVRRIARFVTYGWGAIPAEVRIGTTKFTTSLFPRDGTYLVPIKVAARRQCGITVGDRIELTVIVGDQAPAGVPGVAPT